MAETKPDPNQQSFIKDPATYRAMSEPFADADGANKAVQSFVHELRELRAKHRMRDVDVVMSGSYMTASGEESDFIIDGHIGDADKSEAMLAWAFGRAQAERQERMGQLMRPVIERPKLGKKQ